MKAARRLNPSERSVTQVALECGFSSSQYFATCFRKQFGVSPSTLRTVTP